MFINQYFCYNWAYYNEYIHLIWLSRPWCLLCEFHIRDRFMWTRTVLVHINIFRCVQMEARLSWPPYKSGGPALSRTLRNLISRMGKRRKWVVKKRFSIITLHQAGYSTRPDCMTLFVQPQYAAMAKWAATMTDDVRDVRELPCLVTTNTHVAKPIDNGSWLLQTECGTNFARTGVHTNSPQLVSFSSISEKMSTRVNSWNITRICAFKVDRSW